MTYRYYFILVISFLLAAGCQPPASLKITEATPPAAAAQQELPAKISFDAVIYDFGSVGPDTKNRCQLKFTNTGKGILKISRVQSVCDCTIANLTKKEYEPGSGGILEVEYHAEKIPGPKTKPVYVYSNDNENPAIELTLKANVIPRVRCEPERLTLWPNRENAGCPDIILSSIDGKPFAIKQFTCWPDYITAHYDPNAESKNFIIRPIVNAERLQINSSGYIEIKVSHPETDSVTVHFNIVSDFKVSPPSIAVSDAEPNIPVIRSFWIFTDKQEDFEIESIIAEKNVIKITNQEKMGSRYKFDLEVLPPATENKSLPFADTLIIQIKNGEKLRIFCHGTYKK